LSLEWKTGTLSISGILCRFVQWTWLWEPSDKVGSWVSRR